MSGQMTEHKDVKKESKPQGWKFALPFALIVVALVVAPGSAALNESLYPLIEDMADLFVPILDLIIAAVPVIIAVAFIDFFTGIFGGILRKF